MKKVLYLIYIVCIVQYINFNFFLQIPIFFEMMIYLYIKKI